MARDVVKEICRATHRKFTAEQKILSCAREVARRTIRSATVPPGRHRSNDVLPMVESVSGHGEKRTDAGYPTGCYRRRSETPAGRE